MSYDANLYHLTHMRISVSILLILGGGGTTRLDMFTTKLQSDCPS